MIERALIALLACCAIFGAAIVAELGSADSEAPALAMPAAPAQPSPQPRAQAPAVEDLVATAVARPLFSAARRPAEKASAASADPELPDVRLTGIVMEADRHLAIFAVSGGKPLVRAEGESLKEWRLDSVSPTEVSLSGPGGLRTLTPKTDPNLVRPAPPVLPGPGAAPGQAARPAAVAQPVPSPARPPIAPAVQPAMVGATPPRPAAGLLPSRAPNPPAIPPRPVNVTRAPQ